MLDLPHTFEVERAGERRHAHASRHAPARRRRRRPAPLLALTWTLAVTDFKLRFYGSVLGYVWTLARPLRSSA